MESKIEYPVEYDPADRQHPRDVRKKKISTSSNGVSGVKKSEFLTGLSKLPLVYTTVSLAMDLYGRAKESSRFVNKTLNLAENGAHMVNGMVSPLVDRLTPIASAPLQRVDNLATKGLHSLERTVPAIKKQPQEILTDTKGMLETKLHPTVERLNGVTNSVLSSSLVQYSFDVFEKLLFATGHILNNIVPPAQNTEGAKFPNDQSPEDPSQRGQWLLKEYYHLLSSLFSRVLGFAQSRIDSSANNTAQNVSKKAL